MLPLLYALANHARADEPAPPPDGAAARHDGAPCCSDGKCAEDHGAGAGAHCDMQGVHGHADGKDCADGHCDMKGARGGRPMLCGFGQCIAPVGMAQLWLTVWDQDENPQADSSGYGDPEDDMGVKLKRLELGFTGTGGKGKYDYTLVLGTTAPYDGFDAGDTDAGIKYAHLGVHPFSWLELRAGRMTVPFSRDELMSSSEQVFTETGFVAEHIAPGKRLGANVALHKWGGRLSLGAFNSGGDLFGNDGGPLLNGRLEYSLGKADTYATSGGAAQGWGAGIGVSGSYELGLATTTMAAGADLMVRVAGASLLVDAGLAHLAPASTTLDNPDVWAETDRLALTGQLSYFIKGIEPAVRYTHFDDSSAGTFGQLLGGVTVHGFQDHGRIGAAYVHRFEGETAQENDTVRLWAQVKI